jgi:hypothetical protein
VLVANSHSFRKTTLGAKTPSQHFKSYTACHFPKPSHQTNFLQAELSSSTSCRLFRCSCLLHVQLSLPSSVFPSGEILPVPREVALSDLTKSGGTNLYLLHVVVPHCSGKTLLPSAFYSLSCPLQVQGKSRFIKQSICRYVCGQNPISELLSESDW